MKVELEKKTPFISSLPRETINDAGLYLLGIPYDGSTSFRPGARFGPSAIRESSFGLETYSPYFDRDLEDLKFFDLGDLPFFPSRFEKLKESFFEVTNKMTISHKLITLGGEHSISYLPIKKHAELYPGLIVIHLDAHADLREAYLDDPHSHASVMRRVSEILGSKNLIQYGIRSGTKKEFQWMRREKTLISSLCELIKRIESIPSQIPLYLSLDLDFFDPAYLPGTGTPEAGGESFSNFMSILKALKGKNFIGADLVELAPQIDSTGNSSCFASKVLREVVLAISSFNRE